MPSWTHASRYGRLRTSLYLGNGRDRFADLSSSYSFANVWGYTKRLNIVVRMRLPTESEPAITLEKVHAVAALFGMRINTPSKCSISNDCCLTRAEFRDHSA